MASKRKINDTDLTEAQAIAKIHNRQVEDLLRTYPSLQRKIKKLESELSDCHSSYEEADEECMELRSKVARAARQLAEYETTIQMQQAALAARENEIRDLQNILQAKRAS